MSSQYLLSLLTIPKCFPTWTPMWSLRLGERRKKHPPTKKVERNPNGIKFLPSVPVFPIKWKSPFMIRTPLLMI